MLILDCFMFWNEIEVLYMRLDILYDYVDYFIICESKSSHSGKIKKNEYIFKKNKKLYEKYLDKIIFIEYGDDEFVGKGDKASGTAGIWPNENKQRKWLFNKIKLYPEDSIVAISDVDEIWDPKNIDIIKKNVNEHNVCGVEQRLSYYYVNCFKGFWRGTYFIKRKYLTFNKIQTLRNERSRHPSYVKGGWHFSWLGDVDRLKEKFECIAEHDIIKTHSSTENIKDCITNIKDLFGRVDSYVPKIINIDDNLQLYPKNIKKYIEKFPHIVFHNKEL